MGQPGTKQMLGIKYRQGVRVATRPVAPGTEQIVDTVVPGNGCVSQFEPGKQRAVTFPFVRKSNAFIKRDIAVLGTFRKSSIAHRRAR